MLMVTNRAKHATMNQIKEPRLLSVSTPNFFKGFSVTKPNTLSILNIIQKMIGANNTE